jgi:hypothetical protein
MPRSDIGRSTFEDADEPEPEELADPEFTGSTDESELESEDPPLATWEANLLIPEGEKMRPIP